MTAARASPIGRTGAIPSGAGESVADPDDDQNRDQDTNKGKKCKKGGKGRKK